eukprot:c18470_g1_i1.p1 GENE.c18470_g1_i1~~c18470_g1_i1.p1  ORF type:complete len:484 (-),score=51.64 c18470_g1_i1:158-1609(-)
MSSPPMPTSHANDIPFYPLPFTAVAWSRLSVLLSQPLTSNRALEETLCNLHCCFHVELAAGNIVVSQDLEAKSWPEFEGLAAGIRLVQNAAKVDFIAQVLPRIQAWALEAAELFEFAAEGNSVGEFLEQGIPVLLQGEQSCVRLTRRQARCLLAHAFFGTLGYLPECGDISHFGLYLSCYNLVGPARVACLLNFFVFHYKFPDWIDSPQGQMLVEFERFVCEGAPDWGAIHDQLCPVVISSVLVEDVHPGAPIVDFANRDLHIHRVIPSATQEEVLFSVYPEALLGLLISPRMLETEAIIIRNAVRINNYRGYADTFRFESSAYPALTPESEATPPQLDCRNIIAIDAIVNSGTKEFQSQMIHRDLVKAFVGFQNGFSASVPSNTCGGRCISTGMWGCGVFAGNPILKFLQQWVAATAAGAATLHYCVLQAPTATSIQSLATRMAEAGATVSQASALIMQFGQLRCQKKLGSGLDDWLMVFQS